MTASETPVLIDGPADAGWLLVLAHGAGQPMDSAFMSAYAAGLAARPVPGGVRVLRFELPYMARARRTGRRGGPDREPVLLDAWRARVAAVRLPGTESPRLAIGGKSLGGRIASMVADECAVDALVCLGYPFHPPGRPDRLRTAHLAELATPTLVCQGERDGFGTPSEVGAYRLSPSIDITWIPDGDHGFVPRKRSGTTLEENLERAIDATAHHLARVAAGG